MKRNMNIRLGFGFASALLIATMFASCTKVEFEEPSAKFSDEIRFGISTKNNAWKPDTKSADELAYKEVVARDPNDMNSLGLSMTVIDGIENPLSKTQVNIPATKGTQMNTVPSFDVASYFYAENSSDGVIYFTDQFTDGVSTSRKSYYWPNLGHLNFVATYPSGLFGEAGIQTIADDSGNLKSFEYTVPSDVAQQQDLMIAVTNEVNNSKTDAPVPLEFQHLLAAVQFKVGEMQFIKINSLKITGVYGGTIEFSYNDGVWTPTTSTTVEYDLSSAIYDTSGLIEGDEITSNDNNSILFVAPQTLPSTAKIEVNYTETITDITNTKSASLTGEWVAGKTTVYALNISGTDFGTVEIPRPADQDAHYIMLTMKYDMGGIMNSDKIKSVKATAQWLSGTSNTSTKSGISLKFASELSETQDQGFWTDKRYVETITVTTSGSTSSGISEDDTKDSQGYTGLRGGPSLTITSSTGDIVLFIEENNGTEDREGELLFTATLTTGVEIILGRGSFKQLCPSWNKDGIGVERIEDSNTYEYGFSYNREVVYTSPAENWWLLKDLGYMLYSWGARSVITDDDGDFITLETKKILWFDSIIKVTLNYGELNNVKDISSNDDGLINTNSLYNFTGGNDISQIETDFDENLRWTKTVTTAGNGTPTYYAAYMALSRNRMYEMKTLIRSSEGDVTTYKATLYKDGTDGLTGNDIIEWYLPSKTEAENLLETGMDSNGNESAVINDLNGTYWSSTAGSDTDAKAYTFTFNNNAYSASNEVYRDEKYIVRAVRKKPTTN